LAIRITDVRKSAVLLYFTLEKAKVKNGNRYNRQAIPTLLVTTG
jgi:hypothetical protein